MYVLPQSPLRLLERLLSGLYRAQGNPCHSPPSLKGMGLEAPMLAQGSLPRPRDPHPTEAADSRAYKQCRHVPFPSPPFPSQPPLTMLTHWATHSSQFCLQGPLCLAALCMATVCMAALCRHLLWFFRSPHGLSPCLGSATQLIATPQGFLKKS